MLNRLMLGTRVSLLGGWMDGVLGIAGMLLEESTSDRQLILGVFLSVQVDGLLMKPLADRLLPVRRLFGLDCLLRRPRRMCKGWLWLVAEWVGLVVLVLLRRSRPAHLSQRTLSMRGQDGLVLDAVLVTDIISLANTSRATRPCGGSLGRSWCDRGSVVVVIIRDDNVMAGRANGDRIGGILVSLATV